MNYHFLLTLILYSNALFSMEDKDITIKDKIEIIEKKFIKNPSNHNLKRRSSPPDFKKNLNLKESQNQSFLGKTETILFTKKSFNSMSNVKDDPIIVTVPKGTEAAFNTAKIISDIAHNELNEKIEDINYRTKQMCEEKFKTSDELVVIHKEQRRARCHNRILFLCCTTCVAVYIVISITGIVLGIHFIPLK